MGGDGGSIPDRGDLVKTQRAAPKLDEKVRTRQLWSYCALSKLPLQQPIVSCPLGKLYNKEAVISFLLNPPSATDNSSFGNDGVQVAAHIRNLKDLTTLRLTPNPALATQSLAELERSSNIGTTESRPSALFVCPVSLREMNGSVKFVYRKPCGCVLSEASLREMRKVGEVDQHTCPVDGEQDDRDEEWVTINPRGEELESVKDAWEQRKAREKEEKKAAKDRKRKSTGGGDSAARGEPKAKKIKAAIATPAATDVPSVKVAPSLTSTLQAKIAEQKKHHSPAIASLYAPKGGDANHDADGRSNWMTRGAFTRYA